MSGKSLRVFITGASPRSLKKISMFNWSGYAYYGTRDQIKELKKREDANSQGIYFLFSDRTDGIRLYIGETEDFIQRIEHHARDKEKDWWTRFIVFQSKDNLLNKAHVKYLEYRFWSIAKNTFELTLENGSQSITQTKLSEEDEADLKIFEDNIIYILEGLDISFFSQTQEKPSEQYIYEYYIATSEKEFPAFMAKTENSYILQKGSYLRKEAQTSFIEHNQGSYYAKWKELIQSEKVEDVNDKYVLLKEDIEISSPSLCGALVKGRACNGNTTWRNKKTDKYLKEDIE